METTSSTSTNVWISNEGSQKFGPPDSLGRTWTICVKFRDGNISRGNPQDWYWTWKNVNDRTDIIAYKILKK